MLYTDPLVIKGNEDGAAAVLDNGAIRFDRSYDINDGTSSSLIMVYPPSGIPYIRRYGQDFTLFKIWSPTNSRNAYESTLALVNGDNEEEYLDLYNLNYPSSRNFGIRMQKRGTGEYKPFRFEYSNGGSTYPVFVISPDTTAAFYGKVSIGTTNAHGYKLAVAGNMIAESVKVKLQPNWPDYAFFKNYELPNLASVEKHIAENGHLPGIPSAKEVEANGINLGDMDAKLLLKIEELTLYLIKQQKELEQLKQANKEIELKMGSMKYSKHRGVANK